MKSEDLKIDIRSLKIGDSVIINKNLSATRIVGGYIYESFYVIDDVTTPIITVSSCFVPLLPDSSIGEDNAPVFKLKY